MGRLTEYQVIGRHLPTEANPVPKLYRMRIFAPNTVVAKSRFWYFLMKLRKVKKANGEIITLNVVCLCLYMSPVKHSNLSLNLTAKPGQIHEKRPQKVKNFGIWIRYDSRSGTHNMYKEYREMSRTDAVEALYQDMAARHRSRFRSVHILKVVEIEKTADVKRPYIKQLLTKKLKFPLPHRVAKSSSKKLFAPKRPSTFY
ncbi:MAG: 60S ribosomal protein L20 [Trizodia sp. TS-e1964]|nr:MAG: 60S ribosomal protein L20 [Trizodia sp. TS-e1964]